MTFCLTLCSINFTRKAVRITNNPVNLFTVLPKYYEFVNIFSKAKAETLASYYFYKIRK